MFGGSVVGDGDDLGRVAGQGNRFGEQAGRPAVSNTASTPSGATALNPVSPAIAGPDAYSPRAR